VVYVPDLITCFKFGDDQFRGLASAEGQILPFAIDFDGRPYNTVTLPCERVIALFPMTPNRVSRSLWRLFQKSVFMTGDHKRVSLYTFTVLWPYGFLQWLQQAYCAACD